MMKVNITKVRAEVSVHFAITGSGLAGTILAGAPKVATRYEIEAPDEPAKGASMLRNAMQDGWLGWVVTNVNALEEHSQMGGVAQAWDWNHHRSWRSKGPS